MNDLWSTGNTDAMYDMLGEHMRDGNAASGEHGRVDSLTCSCHSGTFRRRRPLFMVMRTPACDPQSATPTAPEEGPVTVVVSRVVRAEATAAVEAWLEGISRAAERFEGHQGVTIIRPSDSARPEYLLIFRFDRYEHLRQWNESPVRAEWLEHARPFTIEEPRLRELTGLQHWFTLPHRPAGIPPPRHKMAILTWVAISPLVVMLRMILQPLMGGLPAVFQTLAMTAMLVMLMTYIVMPRVTHRSGPGFRDPDGSRCSGGRARG